MKLVFQSRLKTQTLKPLNPSLRPYAKVKLRHLELVGNVMTYKRDEIERKTEPIAAELQRMKQQTIESDAAMAAMISEVEAARVARSKDHDKILGLQGELAAMREQLHAAETMYSRFRDDFRTAMTFVEDDRDEALLRLKRVYVLEAGVLWGSVRCQ